MYPPRGQSIHAVKAIAWFQSLDASTPHTTMLARLSLSALLVLPLLAPSALADTEIRNFKLPLPGPDIPSGILPKDHNKCVERDGQARVYQTYPLGSELHVLCRC